MSKTKKIAILAIIAMVLTLMPTALFAATADSDRLSGDNRIATALDIASAGWTTAGTVVLAPADQANLVDALAAAPLAGQENAPILLTYKGALDATVKQKIADLKATKVYVIGAISDAVAAEVDAISGVTVETLKGSGRQATANAVNAKLTSPAGTFVVGYDAIPDALSVASYAAKNKYKIVLANADGSVDSGLATGIQYIVGGTAKVKDITGATRISGDDRFATNAAVASKLGFSYDRVYVANGVSLVDALAVAPLAAKYNSFVALASGSDVSAASVVNGKLSASSKVIAVGGVNAVPAAVVGKISYAVTAYEVKSVTYLNAKQIEVVFTNAPDKTSAEDESLYFVKRAGDAANVALSTVDATASAKLQDDNKTVIITLTTSVLASLAVNLDAPFNFIVDGVKNSAGTAAPKFSATLVNTDKVAPTVVSVTAKATTTTKTVTVKFSEPVDVATGIYKVNGKIASAAAAAAAREVTLTTQDLLTAGATYDVSIDSVKDVKGNIMSPILYTGTLTVANDSTVDGVKSVTVDGDDTIKIEFGEKMDAATITAANVKVTDPNGAAITAYGIAAKAGDTTGTLFNVTIGAGTNLYANKNSVSVNVTFTDNVKDNTGNKITPVTYALTMTKDTTAPTVSKAEVVGAGGKYDGVTYATGALVVTFSEDIVRPNAGAVAGNLARSAVNLVNQDGLDFTAAVYTADPIVGTVLKTNNANVLVIPFAAAPVTTIKTGTVRIDAKAFTDDALGANGNAAATLTAVDFENAPTGSDTTKPSVTTAPAVAGTNDVSFGLTEVNLDKTSALDVNNYRLDGAPLPTGSYVTLTAASPYTVTVIIPAGNITKSQNYTFVISGVKDKSGNVMDTYAANNVALVDDIKPVLQSATVNTDGTTTLKFSESVQGTVPGDLVVKLNGSTLNAAQYTTTAIAAGADKGGVLLAITLAFDAGTVVAPSTGDERIYVDVDNNGAYNAGTDISIAYGTYANAAAYNGGIADDTDISTLVVKTLVTGATTGQDAAGNKFVNDTSLTVK